MLLLYVVCFVVATVAVAIVAVVVVAVVVAVVTVAVVVVAVVVVVFVTVLSSGNKGGESVSDNKSKERNPGKIEHGNIPILYKGEIMKHF